jgi:hypothetical protein
MNILSKAFAVSVIITLSSIFLFGCVATQPETLEKNQTNRLTTGQVQLTLKKNETTQAEVLEVFGAPNLVTINSEDQEVWTYQKNATISNASSSSAYGTIIIFGATARTSGLEQSSNRDSSRQR